MILTLEEEPNDVHLIKTLKSGFGQISAQTSCGLSLDGDTTLMSRLTGWFSDITCVACRKTQSGVGRQVGNA